MSFEQELINAVGRMSDEFGQAVMLRTGELMRQSVKVGSSLSGARGQPVDSSRLRESINMVSEPDGLIVFVDDSLVETPPGESPPSAYAEGIEHAVGPHGPITLRSLVGGFHSFALTFNAGDAFVTQAARDVLGGSSIGADEGAE